MKYLKTKVLIDYKKVVYRDFLLSADDHLKDVHTAILKAFEFEGKQMASFLKEDENWQAREEYPLEDLGVPNQKLMEKTKVKEVLQEVGDQLSYVYDYLNEWKFHLEVVEQQEKKEKIDSPQIIKKYGTAPKESERDLSGTDAAEILVDALISDKDLYPDDDSDLSNSSDFDSLDDYEEFQ